MNESNYYAIIPATVRYDKNLTASAKLLYAEITSLTHKTGYCYATNEYFAELYGVNQNTVREWLVQLEKAGYINREIVYKENTKEVSERRIRISESPHLIFQPTPLHDFKGENNKDMNIKLENTPYNPPRDEIDFDSFKERWNRNASNHDNIPKVTLMTTERKKALLARLHDLKSNGYLDTIDSFFAKVGEAYDNSEFLQGRRTEFSFTLDFVLQKKSFQKIIEKSYR